MKREGPHSMSDDRISRLENQIDQLKQLVHDLDGRIAALEGPSTSQAAPMPAGPEIPTAEVPAPSFGLDFSATRFMFLLGRAVLILAGGFLLRALTEGGSIPPVAGFALGLLYSLGLILVTYRILGRSDRIGASSLALTTAIVAYPFLTESITKLHLVSAQTGGVALALITAAGLIVAWMRHLRFMAWIFCMAALLTVVGLGWTPNAPEFFALLLLLLGMATVLLAYSRRWHLKRWLVAIATNLVFLRLTVMATTPEGLGSGENHVSAALMLALDLALMVVYLGFFCFRALVQGKGVKVFDVIQSAFVLAIGFGGAVHIAGTTGHGSGALGWTALIAAVVFYSIAFTVVRSRLGRGRGFFYFASLGLIFLFLGSQVMAHGAWLSWTWLVLGIVMALLGSRFDRVTLRTHSVIYLFLASIQTGMLGSALDAFAGSASSPWQPLGQAGTINLMVALFCYGLFIFRPGHDSDSWARRVPAVLAAILALMGLGDLIVVLMTRILTGTPPEAAPTTVAVIRTGVLSVTAIGLAIACRRVRFRELSWLVYPLLGLGCLKLLLEDLRQGNPLTLFLAFGFFGVALILAPRLVMAGRRARENTAATPPP